MDSRFGRYELLRPLGHGGMAEVFLARYVGPEGFEKRLVIKRVLPRYSDDRRLLRMFFEEARTQVSLSHGNLVSVFDFGRVGNEYFIAMEHVHGVDLALLLNTERDAGRRVSPSLVAYLGIELCRGLGYVHRRGLVHRDLSPRNVLLSIDGEVKLSDFGLVLSTAGEVAAGLRGTLAYMAPEQARGDTVDGRADLFALGILLSEALLGKRLRAHRDEQEALADARAGAPVDFTGPFSTILSRATQTSPADRFSTAEEMLTALEREAATRGDSRETTAQELAARITRLTTSAESIAPAPTPFIASIAPTASRTLSATVDLRVHARPIPVESYFRDGESASFVDQILPPAAVPPPVKKPKTKWPLVAAIGVALAGGAAITTTGSHTATRNSTRDLQAPSPSPSSSSAPWPSREPVPATSRPTAPQPTQAAPSPSPSAPLKPTFASPVRNAATSPLKTTPTMPSRRPPATSEAGTLVIKCTPWCIPFVDERARGEDGRGHTIELPAGPHRVQVRRLDDHQERLVQIKPREASTIDFTFK